MTITPTAASAESHTLSFEDETAIEVQIDDNGNVNVAVFGKSPIIFSDDVWDDIVKFVNSARRMSE